MKFFIPMDSAAVSVGAAETAAAVRHAAPDATIVRTGSRGLYWLEPLVEIEQGSRRVGFGPVAVDEAASVVAAIEAGTPSEHPRYIGPVDDVLREQGQRRLTFARCGVI